MSELSHDIKALVFDLDDTLYCQADFKRSGFRAVASWLAKTLVEDSQLIFNELENILEEYGPSYPYMFDIFTKRNNLPKAIAQQMTRIFTEHQPNINCFPGVNELLIKLRPTYHLGILTDGRASTQAKKILALNLKDKIDTILLSDSLNLSKPDQRLFKWFEDKLNLPGSAMVYIGDNPKKDFTGANERQWQTVRVKTGEYANTSARNMFSAQLEIAKVTDILTILE